MTRCPESARVQDYLDGELAAEERRRFEAHLAGCGDCAAELALYRRVFAALEGAPLLEPRPALTGRILARVLPSQVRRRRRLAVLGWSYAAAVAASVAGLSLALVLPASRAALERLSGAASHRLVEAGLFVLDALGYSVLRLADGWGWLHATAMHLAPLARALGALLAEPSIAVTLWAAAAACGALLWWMRPRARFATKEVRHVGVLGF